MPLADLTDTELLAALAMHPNAPSVRFYADGGVRRVHAGKLDAAELRHAAQNEHRDVRQGPGFIAAAFYDMPNDVDVYIVARAP